MLPSIDSPPAERRRLAWGAGSLALAVAGHLGALAWLGSLAHRETAGGEGAPRMALRLVAANDPPAVAAPPAPMTAAAAVATAGATTATVAKAKAKAKATTVATVATVAAATTTATAAPAAQPAPGAPTAQSAQPVQADGGSMPPQPDASPVQAAHFYTFDEVELPAAPVSDWELDAATLDSARIARLVFDLFVSDEGSVVGCAILEPAGLDDGLRLLLEARLRTTPLLPAVRTGRAVPSVRRIELTVS